MDYTAIALLTAAGLIHGLWNLLAKQSQDKQAFLWLALCATAVGFFIPFCLLYQPIPPPGWALIALSGGLETLYFILLSSAYARGDLSLVYPLARGSAILFATLGGVALLGEQVTPLGSLGIALILVGVYTLHLQTLSRPGLFAPLLALRQRPSQLALLTGLTIAAYSVVDKVGVRYVAPVPYLYLILLIPALLLAPFMLLARRPAVRQEWRARPRTILLAGLLSVAPYLIALIVLTTTPVSYVAPVREVSIVFGAALGTLVLHEPFGPTKLLGATLIFLGILAIGLAH